VNENWNSGYIASNSAKAYGHPSSSPTTHNRALLKRTINRVFFRVASHARQVGCQSRCKPQPAREQRRQQLA
jgi:hypothetical protein